MDEYTIRSRIDRYFTRKDTIPMVFDQKYRDIELTNVDLSCTDIYQTASFARPDNSGVIDFGNPWGYRFLIVKFTKDRVDGVVQRRKVDYMVKAGCKWLTREQAYKYWDLNRSNSQMWRKNVATWNRVGVTQLLQIADIRANLYWGCTYKVPK